MLSLMLCLGADGFRLEAREKELRGEGGSEPAKDKQELFTVVKLATLIATPAKYHGMLVVVAGYRRNGAMMDDLYVSKAEADAKTRSASIQLAGFKDPEKAVFSLAEHEAISDTEVRVLGVFYADDFFPEQKGYLTQLRWIVKAGK